jgi:sterol 3beta-glucosyltransferase
MSDYFVNNLKLLLRHRDGKAIRGAWVLYDPPFKLEDTQAFDARQPADGSILTLVAMNRQLLDPLNQWGPRYRFTGFWEAQPRPGCEPGEDLQAFVEQGPAPVVLTMGSMVMFDPARLAQVFAEALRLAGQRGVLVGGWSGISRALPPGLSTAGAGAPLFCVDEAPYHWLFPRAACVIHHGGCGTLSAVLRAGQPSVLLPQIPPQELFGRILEREGLAAGTLDADTLQPAALADAIRRAVTDAAVRENCRRWQPLIAAERGVQLAADLIEAHGPKVSREW